MKILKGLFIEDDKSNIYVYTELLKSEGLELIYFDSLPNNLNEYYDFIIKNNIDFLIIDYHLDKQVPYKGIDVLKEIRKYDDTIYSILLTNYDLDNFKEEFGEYDYEIAKKEFSTQYKNIAEKIKRACEFRNQNQISKSIDEKINSDEKVISLLEEIKSKLN